MSSAVDCSEGQRTSAARYADSAVPNLPVAKSLGLEGLLARPLKIKRHPFVPDLPHPSTQRQEESERRAHPVADPVVRADIYEHADAALEERADVELGREHHVHRRAEAQADLGAAGREVGRQRRVDADRLADVGAVEEGVDLPGDGPFRRIVTKE